MPATDDNMTVLNNSPEFQSDPHHPLRSFFGLRQAHANTSYTVGVYSAAHRIITVAHDAGDADETPAELQYHARQAINTLTDEAQSNPEAASLYKSLRFGTNIRFSNFLSTLLFIAFITAAGSFLYTQVFPQGHYPALAVLASTAVCTIAFITARRWHHLRAATTAAEDYIAQHTARIANTKYQTSHRITDQHRVIIVMPLPHHHARSTSRSTPSCAS